MFSCVPTQAGCWAEGTDERLVQIDESYLCVISSSVATAIAMRAGWNGRRQLHSEPIHRLLGLRTDE